MCGYAGWLQNTGSSTILIMSLMMNTVFVSLELRRLRTVTPCDRITGGVFVSFGLKLVFDTRALVKN